MKKFWIIILALFIFSLFLLIYAYLSLEKIKVKEEKVYILPNCNCKDFLKFRKQYKGLLVDQKGQLCSLKCKI